MAALLDEMYSPEASWTSYVEEAKAIKEEKIIFTPEYIKQFGLASDFVNAVRGNKLPLFQKILNLSFPEEKLFTKSFLLRDPDIELVMETGTVVLTTN